MQLDTNPNPQHNIWGFCFITYYFIRVNLCCTSLRILNHRSQLRVRLSFFFLVVTTYYLFQFLRVHMCRSDQCQRSGRCRYLPSRRFDTFTEFSSSWQTLSPSSQSISFSLPVLICFHLAKVLHGICEIMPHSKIVFVHTPCTQHYSRCSDGN